MSKFFKCGGSSSSSHGLENEEYEVVEKGKDLLPWNIPRVPIGKIYSRKIFSFSSDFSIKTNQGKGSLNNGGGYMNLIDGAALRHREWLRNKYDLIHIGMVQIGVKTLTRIPLNASVILSLCDARHESLQDSLLGIVESNLSDGPFYFNVFPNISGYILNNHDDISDMLLLNAKIKDFEKLPQGPKNIILMYRICYKLMKNDSATRALVQSPTGKTVFFQTDHMADQRVTKWDQVQLPESWPSNEMMEEDE